MTTPSRQRSAGAHLGEIGLLIALLLMFWQAMYYVAGDTALSPPIETFKYTAQLILSSDFWPHVFTTGTAFICALVIVVAGGPIIGAVLATSKLSGEVAEPILVALYSIPKVVLYPIILLFFGIGLGAEVAFGALHGIVPVMLFTMNAVRNIKPVLIKTGRVLGLSQSAMMRTILFPAAFPEIFTGLRIGFSVTLLGTIMSEMFGSKRGLGFLLMNALGMNNVELIMSLALVMVAFAALMNTALVTIENRLFHRS